MREFQRLGSQFSHPAGESVVSVSANDRASTEGVECVEAKTVPSSHE